MSTAPALWVSGFGCAHLHIHHLLGRHQERSAGLEHEGAEDEGRRVACASSGMDDIRLVEDGVARLQHDLGAGLAHIFHLTGRCTSRAPDDMRRALDQRPAERSLGHAERGRAGMAVRKDLGAGVEDPLWPMPLWANYDSQLSSKIADMNNTGSGGYAGSVTAALFLRRFVKKANTWLHLDIFGWAPEARPGRPVGATDQGIRALHALIRERYGH